MNKQTFLVSFLAFIVTTAIAVGGYVLFINKNEGTQEVAMTQVADNDSDQTQTTPQSNQQSSLRVQGATNQNQQSFQGLPTPDDFEQYESYAQEQSTVYLDVSKGSGLEAQPGDRVAMLYKGWLTNGELFDQSRPNEQGQIEPLIFDLGSGMVIPGWEQGIAGMKEGGKRRLVIPSALAYGPQGQGPIPPNSLLVFDVELVKVQKASPQL